MPSNINSIIMAGLLIAAATLASVPAMAQTYPHPTFGALTVTSSGGSLNVNATNIGTSQRGRTLETESSWLPGVIQGAPNYNFLDFISAPSIGLANRAGASVADLWGTTNIIRGIYATTTSAMANSHTLAQLNQVVIPAGLGDGAGGVFSASLPTNPIYQESAATENNCFVLSPGHYTECVGSYVFDNFNGTGAVPIKATAVFAAVSKDSATNTYPIYGFQADSYGTQTAAFSPNAAFRVDGAWQVSLDLSGNTYAGSSAILFPFSSSMTVNSSNLFIGVAGASAMVLNAAAATFPGVLSSGTFFQAKIVTVATLPACVVGIKGALMSVSDATAPTYNGALVGGGTIVVPVFCNGTAWTSH